VFEIVKKHEVAFLIVKLDLSKNYFQGLLNKEQWEWILLKKWEMKLEKIEYEKEIEQNEFLKKSKRNFPRGFVDGYENLLNYNHELVSTDKNYSDNYDLGYKFRILHVKALDIIALESEKLTITDFNENNLKTVQLLAGLRV
jgi:hypothetical protein